MADEDKKKKETWISDKIEKLVKEEGKSQEQAVSMASSMWEEEHKNPKEKNDSIAHVDFMDFDMSSKMEETDEGFLIGRSIVTNVGVFSYLNKDGSVRRELRTPEEVFNPDSLATLIGKPLTDDHPTEFVDKNNVKDYEVGTVMSPVVHDEYHVSAGLSVRSKDAISKIKSGKVALSCGYNLTLDFTPGAWMGVEYDCIQRNIRYNHVSLVDRGRAGDAAKIHMDAAVDYSMQIIKEVPAMVDKPMRTINLDNVEYQAEDAVIEALKSANTRADSVQVNLDKITAEKSAIEAERDSYKEKNEILSKEVTDMKAKALDAVEVDKKVKARIALLDSAKKAKVEVTDNMDEAAIREAIIKIVFPKANLDGKDASYLQARFDVAMESLDSVEMSEADTRALNGDTAAAEPSESEKARKRMLDRAKGITVQG